MEIIKIGSALSADEKETILNYDHTNKLWIMDSTIPKHFHKAQKQGWTPIKQYIYEDGTICGMVLTAAERAITIRNTAKKQMSDKQLTNLSSVDDE